MGETVFDLDDDRPSVGDPAVPEAVKVADIDLECPVVMPRPPIVRLLDNDAAADEDTEVVIVGTVAEGSIDAVSVLEPPFEIDRMELEGVPVTVAERVAEWVASTDIVLLWDTEDELVCDGDWIVWDVSEVMDIDALSVWDSDVEISLETSDDRECVREVDCEVVSLGECVTESPQWSVRSLDGDAVLVGEGVLRVRDWERVVQQFPKASTHDVVVNVMSLLRDFMACWSGVVCNHEQAVDTVMAAGVVYTMTDAARKYEFRRIMVFVS